MVNVGGICQFSWQCIGAGACNNGSCSCSSGYTQIDGNCYPGKIFCVNDDKYHSLSTFSAYK